jgi:hypothetical protein
MLHDDHRISAFAGSIIVTLLSISVVYHVVYSHLEHVSALQGLPRQVASLAPKVWNASTWMPSLVAKDTERIDPFA